MPISSLNPNTKTNPLQEPTIEAYFFDDGSSKMFSERVSFCRTASEPALSAVVKVRVEMLREEGGVGEEEKRMSFGGRWR